MLTCREVTAKATRMIDGDLLFRERIAAHAHLFMCANCHRFARQLRALVDSLQVSGVREDDVSPELHARVMAARSAPPDSER